MDARSREPHRRELTPLAAIVRAQDAERRRLAAVLHDDAVQVMAAVALRIGLLRRTLSAPAQIEACEELEAIVARSTAGLRGLIAELHPAELEQIGLEAAIRAALDRIGEADGLEHALDCRLPREPEPAIGTAIFRIFADAISNIRRHASASRVGVTLSHQNAGIFVRISDDGAGFDVAAALGAPDTRALGLVAMRARAELAGGWLEVTSGAGGTIVEYWMPTTAGVGS